MRLAAPPVRGAAMNAAQAFSTGAAVVTGAGSGIGEGIARQAASLGMQVVLADVTLDRAERVAEDIRAGGGQAIAVHTDVRNPSALDRLADPAHGGFGDG